MKFHIHTPAKGWLPRRRSLESVLLVAFLMSASVASAIVKQQQQQQQRSDDPSSGYNNHQQPSGSQPAALQQAAPGPQGSGQNPSNQQQLGPSQGNSAQAPASQQQSVASVAAQKQQQPQTSYMDSMAAAASNPEQSYQAAAASVNMALANSGILGNGPQAQAQQQQAGLQQQASGGQAAPGAGSALNPLHYFYYPAAKESSAQGPQKPVDMMANAASNQYQSMANYPTYADQYSGAYPSAQGSPDAAASSQDPSYLPQPMDPQQQQQQNGLYGQQHQQHSQQQPGQQQNFGGDLAGYGSQQMPQQIQQAGQQQQQQQQPGSISFAGPSSGPQSGIPQDYMNQQSQPQHMGQHQAGSGANQQQQQPPAYQQGANSLFSQLASGGDLSTSNFGNNAGGLSSIASYMSPNSQQGSPQGQTGHDLFSPNGLLGGASSGASQFNSAASQLSPAAIAPPPQQAQQQQPGQQQQQPSLFSGGPAASLFGSSQQQAPGQQSSGLFGGGASALGNSYLSSFLSPQQYSQLTGQQMSAMASEQSPLSLASAIGAQQQAQQQQAQAASAAAANSMASGSSSKRFGLGSFIMPMLALAGLSLLIPTMSNIGTAVGRKKRSIVEEKASASNRQQQIAYDPMNGASQLLKESSIGEYLEKIERYYGIYKNAVESDDCMNRLICEFGNVVRDYTGKGVAVMSVVERMVPQWMTPRMHLFKEAALNNKEGKEKCKKYICHSGGSRQQH